MSGNGIPAPVEGPVLRKVFKKKKMICRQYRSFFPSATWSKKKPTQDGFKKNYLNAILLI